MKKLFPLTLGLCLSTCSGMNGLGELMMDAGELLADAGNGNAQTATPQKVLTADTDATRLEGGVLAIPMATVKEVALGPIVITHLAEGDGATSMYVFLNDAAVACDASTAPRFRAAGFEGVFVKQGKKLCAYGSGFGGTDTNLFWSGYRPY